MRRKWPQLDGDETLMWRADQLADAGMSEQQALSLALDARVDLHEAVSLMRRGCHPDIAFDILSA